MSRQNPDYPPDDLLLFVTLNDHLDRLKATETLKPPDERLSIPTLTELARATGLHRVTVTNLANNNVSQISRETIGKLVAELRRRGFKTEIQDVMAFFRENSLDSFKDKFCRLGIQSEF